jgi:hypothetical protein
MNSAQYEAFTSELVDSLHRDPRVLGIVALGSMAARSRKPDQWSDHDFFVITTPGAQEGYRLSTVWLPDAQRIAVHFRETAHGCKALYDDGHLAEYAIFDAEELNLARVNDWRVLLDRERIEERMRVVEATTRTTALHDHPPASKLAAECLSNLLVAGIRARRGERVSARLFLTYATMKLAAVLAAEVASPSAAVLDSLDPTRRMEIAFPDEAAGILAALRMSEEEAVVGLLGVARAALPTLFSDRAVEAVLRAVCAE